MSKYTYFPRNTTLSRDEIKLKRTFWVASEIDYEQDKAQMRDLQTIASSGHEDVVGGQKIVFSPTQAKNIIIFVKNILCLFAQLDGVVIENLLENFVEGISMGEKEIKDFYIIQAANELVHSETYSTQVEELIDSDEEKRAIYTASLEYPAVAKITDWSLTWFDTSLPIIERLVAFCCIEGIVFTSGFVAIYRLKEWGLFLNGLCKANEWISKDEGVHTDAGILFFHHKINNGKFVRPSQERVYEIVQAAVDLACQFTDDAVRPDLIGLDAGDMKDYIRLAADSVIRDLGYETRYNIKANPFPWMEKINLFNIGNFFETRVSEYQRQAVEEDAEEWSE